MHSGQLLSSTIGWVGLGWVGSDSVGYFTVELVWIIVYAAHYGLLWIGFVNWWVGLGYVKKNGSMSVSRTVYSTMYSTVDPTIASLMFVSAYRYIAITHLPIIPVFVEYLRQFLIDFNKFTGIVVCQKHVSVNFSSFLAPAVSEHGAAATFFVILCLSRCRESLDCLTLA